MRTRLTKLIAVAILLLPTHSIHARSPAAPGTIYGKVHDNGIAAKHILVQVMIGDCFSPIVKALSTNDSGFYRVDGLPIGRPIHIGLNGFRAHGALNKDYKANCSGKGVQLKPGLNRHNIALEKN